MGGTLIKAAEVDTRYCESLKAGKLQMQSNLNSLVGKLNLNLWDCGLLVETGVSADTKDPTPPIEAAPAADSQTYVGKLLGRLQIRHAKAKNRAVDRILDALREDEKIVQPDGWICC